MKRPIEVNSRVDKLMYVCLLVSGLAAVSEQRYTISRGKQIAGNQSKLPAATKIQFINHWHPTHSAHSTAQTRQLTCIGHISLLRHTTKTLWINMSELVVPVTDCCWQSGWCNLALSFIALWSNLDFCLELNGSAGWNFRKVKPTSWAQMCLL